jgi:hypothetical protein
VMRDAKKWEEDTERDASEFDAEYYGRCWGRLGKRLPLSSGHGHGINDRGK